MQYVVLDGIEEKGWCAHVLFRSSFESGLNLVVGTMPRSYVFNGCLPVVMCAGIYMVCLQNYVCFVYYVV